MPGHNISRTTGRPRLWGRRRTAAWLLILCLGISAGKGSPPEGNPTGSLPMNAQPKTSPPAGPPAAIGQDWFPRRPVTEMAVRSGVDFIPALRGYQQTTEYTCGPAALLSVALYYQVTGIASNATTELRIAREAGTRFPENLPPGSKLGTKPQEMAAWLEKHGLEAQLEFEEKGDGSGLRRLRENIRQGWPTLVEWIDLGGHWAVAVGYDDRQNADPWDDVLILADPYDRYDDIQDGYTFVNANRFYWMWFDVHYFDRETWRTMITVKPKAARPQPGNPRAQ